MKSILKIIIYLFVILIFIILGVWIFLKIHKPTTTLPLVDYVGMSKNEILQELNRNSNQDFLSKKVLIHIPLGRTIDIQDLSASEKAYLLQNSIWDVNYTYARDKIKGGYYFYRLYFNNNDCVKKQEECFQSSIGLFGL